MQGVSYLAIGCQSGRPLRLPKQWLACWHCCGLAIRLDGETPVLSRFMLSSWELGWELLPCWQCPLCQRILCGLPGRRVTSSLTQLCALSATMLYQKKKSACWWNSIQSTCFLLSLRPAPWDFMPDAINLVESSQLENSWTLIEKLLLLSCQIDTNVPVKSPLIIIDYVLRWMLSQLCNGQATSNRWLWLSSHFQTGHPNHPLQAQGKVWKKERGCKSREKRGSVWNIVL